MFRHTYQQFHKQFSWISIIATLSLISVAFFYIFQSATDPFISTKMVSIDMRIDRFISSSMSSMTVVTTMFLGLVYFAVLAAYQFGNPHGFNWQRLSLSPTDPKYRFVTNLLYGLYKVLTFLGILKTVSFLQHTLPSILLNYFYIPELQFLSEARIEESLEFFTTYGLPLIFCLIFVTTIFWFTSQSILSKASRVFITFELSCFIFALMVFSYPFSDDFVYNDILPNLETGFTLVIAWFCSYSFSLLCISYLKKSLEAILFSTITQFLILMITLNHTITIIKTQFIAILAIIFCLYTSYQLLTSSKSQSKLKTSIKSIYSFIPFILFLTFLTLFLRIKVNYMNLEKEPYHYSYDQNENSLHVHQLRKTDKYYMFPALDRPIQTVTKVANISRHISPKIVPEEYVFRFQENPSAFKSGLDIKIYQNKKLLDTFYMDRLSFPKNTSSYKYHHDYFKVKKGQKSFSVIAKDPNHGVLLLSSTSGEYFKYVVGSQKLELIDGVITPIGVDPITGIQNLKDQPYFIVSKNGVYQLQSTQEKLTISSKDIESLRVFNHNDQTFYHNNSIYSFEYQYFDPAYNERPHETEITLKSLNLITNQLSVKKSIFKKGQRVKRPLFSKGKLYFSTQKRFGDLYEKEMYFKEVDAKKSFNTIAIDTIESLDFDGKRVPLLVIKKTKSWQYRLKEDYFHLNGYFVSTSMPGQPKDAIQSPNLLQVIPKLRSTIIFPDITSGDRKYPSDLIPAYDSLDPYIILPSGEVLLTNGSVDYNSNATHFYTFNPHSNKLKLHVTPAQWERFPIFEDRKGKLFTVPPVLNRSVQPVYAKQIKLTDSNKEISHEN